MKPQPDEGGMGSKREFYSSGGERPHPSGGDHPNDGPAIIALIPPGIPGRCSPISCQRGNIDVLSGTATMFRVPALRP